MSKFNTFAKNVCKEIVKQGPAILAGASIVGMGTAVIFGIKVTPKAVKLIENRKKELNTNKLDTKEVIKTTWKCYIPTAAMFVASTGCLIASHRISARRCTAFATAYKISEAALTEYQNKVVETIGEKKEKDIRTKIAKDHIDKNPPKNNEIIVTGKGDVRCYEIVSGRYFNSDIDKIRKAVNELNRRLIVENYISLNEFYYALGLRPTDMGNDLGWNVADGLIEVTFSSHLDESETPCLVLDYHISPRYNFGDLH